MKIKVLLFSMLIMGITVACTKTPGCTDYSADNYNSDAEENDGSCTYSGDCVFWTASQFNYIDVTLNGFSNQISLYYPNGGVDCSSSGCAHFNLPVGTYNYYAEEQGLNGAYWSGSVQIEKKLCKTLLLTP